MSIKCVGCDTPIPYGKTKCPMCGAPTKYDQPENVVPEVHQVPVLTPVKSDISAITRYGGRFLKAVFGFCFCVLVFGALFGSCGKKSTTAEPTQADIDRQLQRVEADNKFDAEERAKFIVKGVLKAPSTAKFSDIRVTKSANIFEVTGSVDSQNSFGAMLRSSFSAVFKKTGEKWEIVDFKM